MLGPRTPELFLVALVACVPPYLMLGQKAPEGFVKVLPSEIKWQPNNVLSGVQEAVLLGDPAKSGEPIVIRVKLPPQIKVMPHTHPDARTYTVLSGEWKLGFGDRFDPAALQTFPAGSVYRLPAGVAHFQATGSSETVIQIESLGPSRTDFLPEPSAPPPKP